MGIQHWQMIMVIHLNILLNKIDFLILQDNYLTLPPLKFLTLIPLPTLYVLASTQKVSINRKERPHLLPPILTSHYHKYLQTLPSYPIIVEEPSWLLIPTPPIVLLILSSFTKLSFLFPASSFSFFLPRLFPLADKHFIVSFLITYIFF